MVALSDLKVKIFADGADLADMLAMNDSDIVSGMTTNPSLMRKAGVEDYKAYAKQVLQTVKTKPVSFEVFSDEFEEMERQANEIAAWGENVYVKIPVMNTRREPSFDLVSRLAKAGVKVNVTAILTLEQVRATTQALEADVPSYISVFAGRIADTGRDPVPVMQQTLAIMASKPKSELIWASVRELFNVFQANALGCHIITVPNSIIDKFDKIGFNLTDYSHETVEIFYRDATAAGFSLD